jgi:hypothetical protein
VIPLRLPKTSCSPHLAHLSCTSFQKFTKPDNPGRPIVSVCGCPTEPVSSFLDRVMAPLVKDSPSYIKDTKHALQIHWAHPWLPW